MDRVFKCLFPSVYLKKDGRDVFIDYLKGLAIICVVLTHYMPFQDELLFPFWGGQAVPLFLLIQVFHFYKHGVNDTPILSIKKMWRRIIGPYLIAELILFLINWIARGGGGNLLVGAIRCGGFGNGNYYFWIYIEFAFLLPLATFLFRKYSNWFLFFVWLAIAMVLEIVCSYADINAELYRLLCLRYVYLIYLGYLWAKLDKIELNYKTIILSIISAFFIFLFNYRQLDLSPFFFNSAWSYFHWICYFYPAFLLVVLLSTLYHFLGKRKILNRIRLYLEIIGKCSYEIFLWQMIFKTVLRYSPIHGPLFFCIGVLGSIAIPVFVKRKKLFQYN